MLTKIGMIIVFASSVFVMNTVPLHKYPLYGVGQVFLVGAIHYGAKQELAPADTSEVDISGVE